MFIIFFLFKTNPFLLHTFEFHPAFFVVRLSGPILSMLFEKLLSVVVYVLSLFVCSCSAVKLLPRAHHDTIGSPAFTEGHEVAFNSSDRPDQVPLPRLMIPTLPPQEPLANTESAAAQVKRKLLGNRQICSRGYGYCRGQCECVLLFYFSSLGA
jgi:hypothetical protein